MEELVDLLRRKNMTISMAESCTGGLLAACIVSVADASKVFNQSFVTYTEEAKMKYAHVNKETIEKYSVVSEEVALEMAKGVQKESNSNVGIGITGYAGPSGDNVGLVCFGLAINNDAYSYEMWFHGSRNEIRAQAVEYIVRKTIEKLEEIE